MPPIDNESKSLEEVLDSELNLSIEEYHDAVNSLAHQIITQCTTVPGSICLDALAAALSYVVASHPDEKVREDSVKTLQTIIPQQVDNFRNTVFAPREEEAKTTET